MHMYNVISSDSRALPRSLADATIVPESSILGEITACRRSLYKKVTVEQTEDWSVRPHADVEQSPEVHSYPEPSRLDSRLGRPGNMVTRNGLVYERL